jgi:endonuclease-3
MIDLIMNSKKAVSQLKFLKKMIKNKTIRLAAEWPRKWQVLISTILSPQTRDEVTIPICENLFKKYPSIKALSRARVSSVEELLKLPGVGRKVANVYLAEANKADAIGVDTHVKRIAYKLSWTKSVNPVKIEKDLEKLFPKKYWREINDTLVRFGKIFGTSRKREDEILDKIK